MSKKRAPHTSLDGLRGEDILTPNDLAEILQISGLKVREMLSSGEIEGMFRAGRLLRIRVKDVRAWIEATKIPRNPRIHEIRQAAQHRHARRDT